MVFNATFNNISVILWRSVLLVEETGGIGGGNRGYWWRKPGDTEKTYTTAKNYEIIHARIRDIAL
jgi:hypothetical protein